MTQQSRWCVRLVVDGIAARVPGFTHRRVTGYWEPVALEDIKAGDIFRLYEPDGTPDRVVDGVHQTAVALDDARPWAGTVGVQAMPVRGFKQ